MHCPVCENVNLVMSERSGIEIDYCPTCRGVWLDRGELDKIIERSANTPSTQPSNPSPSYPQDRRVEQHPTQYHENKHDKKKKREGFFSDLFDFD